MFDVFDLKKGGKRAKEIIKIREEKREEIHKLKERIAILEVQEQQNTRLYKKWVKELTELEK